MPAPHPDLDNPIDTARRDRLFAPVDEMLGFQRRHAEAEHSLDDARHDVARRIAAVDEAIDALVYELYGLTEDEIARVRSGA